MSYKTEYLLCVTSLINTPRRLVDRGNWWSTFASLFGVEITARPPRGSQRLACFLLLQMLQTGSWGKLSSTSLVPLGVGKVLPSLSCVFCLLHRLPIWERTSGGQRMQAPAFSYCVCLNPETSVCGLLNIKRPQGKWTEILNTGWRSKSTVSNLWTLGPHGHTCTVFVCINTYRLTK